jgi:hypothetical protein
MKATVITMLLIAVGRPNITSKLTWIFLAGAFGYSWSVERTLKKVLLKHKDYLIRHEQSIRDSSIISNNNFRKKMVK